MRKGSLFASPVPAASP